MTKKQRQDKLNEAWCKYMGKCSTEIMEALAFALRWYDEHPHWISVEDKLPKLIVHKLLWDYSDDVLVYLKDGSITVGRWERDNSTGEQYWLLDIDKDVIVTHWMCLPSVEHLKK